MLKAMRPRVLLGKGCIAGPTAPGLFVSRVKVIVPLNGAAKICVTPAGFNPSEAVEGTVPSALKFKPDAKTTVEGVVPV
jgi:hypothetical protein